jgi:CRISPR-associated protein Csh1
MIEAIKNLGIVALKKEIQKRGISQNIFTNRDFTNFRKNKLDLISEMLSEKIECPKKGKIQVFILSNEGSIKEEDWKFFEEEYDEQNYYKYLYKKASGRKTWFSPTFVRAEKIEECYRKFEAFNLSDYPFNIIYKLFFHFLNRIKEKWSDSSQNKIIFTFKIDGNYLNKITAVTNKFLDNILARFCYPKKNRASNGYGNCFVCGKYPIKVLGAVRPYNFYAVDNEGYFQGLQVENAWKNFPVCENCAFLLEFGKIFIDNHFDHTAQGERINIAGYNVKIIPKLLMLEDKLKEVFKQKVFEKIQLIAEKKFPDEIEKIPDRESYLLLKLNEMEIVASYEFLFYKQKQEHFEILRHISNVLPSRINKIAEFIKALNDKFLIDNFFKINNLVSLKFGILFNLFSPVSNNTKEHYAFNSLTILDCIFTGKNVSYHTLLRDFSARLRAIYLNSINQKQSLRLNIRNEIFLMVFLFEFLQRLGVMKMNYKNEVDKVPDINILSLNEFINDRKSFFNLPEKIVCFLIGILFGKIESIQIADRGTAPIQKHIKSLNITKRDLERLFSIIRLKFMEYHAFSSECHEIAGFLSSEWTKISEWKLLKDEIPFYFSLGWVLYKKFLPPKKL